jgi:hypothetical protein
LPASYGDLGVRYDDLARLEEAGLCEVRRIDWGAWAARMTGHQIRALFASDAVKAGLVAELDAERFYLLVAAEGV